MSSRAVSATTPTAGDFEAGLRTLLDGDRWRACGEAAYDYVRTTHALDIVIEKHLDAYRSLVETDHRPAQIRSATTQVIRAEQKSI